MAELRSTARTSSAVSRRQTAILPNGSLRLSETSNSKLIGHKESIGGIVRPLSENGSASKAEND
jgi:hypothetical protein